MKKFKFSLLFSVLLLNSCALLVMNSNYSSVETSYFKIGFDDEIVYNNQDFELLDSSHLSENNIQLIRENQHEIYSYWVSVDTLYKDFETEEIYVSLKIINSKGRIDRFVDGWINVKGNETFDFKNYTLKESSKGNVKFCFGDNEYFLIHLGDEIGLHHTEILKPINLNEKACLSMQFWGNDYQYHWVELYKETKDFYKIYKYSYNGGGCDSLFVQIPEGLKKEGLKSNYHLQADYHYVTIYNHEKVYKIKIDKTPFNGFGVDAEIRFTTPVLHSLQKDNYFHQTLMQVFEDEHSIDFLRSETYLTTLNNTVKSIGYKHFISLKDYNKPQVRLTPYGMDYVSYLEHGMSLSQFSDSLLYYSSYESENKYYNEFWTRRQKEGTKEVVIRILKEIKTFYAGEEVSVNENGINDTLQTLLKFDVSFRESEDVKEKLLLNYYDYLMSLGLNQSAYNLIFASDETKDVLINRDSIYEDLLIQDKAFQVKGKKMFLSVEEPNWVNQSADY